MLVAHISDLHLGRKSPGDPHGAERLNSFRQAITTLAGFKPDVIVIAGDTFDSPKIDPAVIEEAARSLSGAKNEKDIAVVVISGNHDPGEEEKLWATFQKSLETTSVHVVLTPRVIELAEGKLIIEAYPCASQYSPAPPWEKRLRLPAGAERAVRVILAHGTLQGGPVPEGETDAYPFTQASMESLGADYVALGHFHGLYPPWDGDEMERPFGYCGTHEPDQFGGDAGYAVLAEVCKGQPTRLRRMKVGKRQWRLLPITCPADVVRFEDVRKEIAASEDPSRYVIRLKVEARTGWKVKEIEQLDKLEGTLRALGAEVERRGTVSARVEAHALDLTGLPSGAVKEALLSLQAELGSGVDRARQEILAAAIQLGWEKIQEAMPS